jgi:hypothetical protein
MIIVIRGMRIIFFCVLGLSVVTVVTTLSTAAEATEACTEKIIQAEKDLGLPRGLLLAISLVETGRDGTPHAYAMSVGGRTVMAESAARVRHYLRDRHGRVAGAVFAGCMQISTTAHHENFQPIERILEPAQNVRYGAELLKRLRDQSGSWAAAVAHYQGGTHDQQRQYVCAVWRRFSVLNVTAVKIMNPGHCRPDDEVVAIAPETRRVFHQAQLAELPVPDPVRPAASAGRR